MKQNKDIGFCTIGQTPSACPKRNEYDSTIIENENMFIYKRKKNINYQITLQPGIWNREYLCIFFNNNLIPPENLLIGAWNNYIKFNPLHKITSEEFISLCEECDTIEEWGNLYLEYYK